VGGRVYRTGDLGRRLPDGSIVFAGRKDFQVKVRGFRVELAEIEAALSHHSAVRENVVVLRKHDSGDSSLAAYVVLNAEQAASEIDFRAFLKQALPEYMLPAAFVVLESLPLTASGKLNRRALPEPKDFRGQPKVASAAPQTTVEKLLAKIWSDLLAVKEPGVNDNFFELGGHSLLATQIISRIRSTFRVQLPLHSFLETPTVSGLAEKISQCPVVETEDQEMARLLQELEGLSDEEAERLLAAEMEKNNERGTGSSGQ